LERFSRSGIAGNYYKRVLMAENKGQHYLSSFYLYRFTNEEQKRENQGKKRRETKIWHYDIIKKKVNERPIKNLAKENYFFLLEI